MKKIMCYLMCLLMAFGAIGCGASGDIGDSDKEPDIKPDNMDEVTVVKVMNFNGGVGAQWLMKAKNRFQEQNKETSFENGKKGVYIAVEGTTNIDVNSLKTAGYNMYFCEAIDSIYALAQKGLLVDINDIVTEKTNGKSIEDIIYPEQRSACKGGDGHYYALPHYEWYPGLTFDKDLFDKNKLYIAKEDASSVENHKGVKFVQNLNDKSCGKDGVFGTDDDGLPTSLKELIALCSYMSNKNDIEPITISGGNRRYSDYLLFSLWGSLAGKDEISTMYSFNGEVNCVTGFTQEPLFPGMGYDYIKKPIVEKVTITEKDGWKAHETAAKYYTCAFLKILFEEKLFSKDAWESTLSHTDAQANFIMGSRLSGKDKGIAIEGSYWYNEAVDAGSFNDFQEYFGDEERHLQFMPLPCSLDTPVTEGQGVKNVLMDEGHSYSFINGNIKNDGVKKACKAFMKFLYSEEENKAFSIETGVYKALDYSLSDTDIDKINNDFQKGVLSMRRNSDIVYGSADNPTFRRGQFKISVNTPMYNTNLNGIPYTNFMDALRTTSCSAQELFLGSSLKDSWSRYYVEE